MIFVFYSLQPFSLQLPSLNILLLHLLRLVLSSFYIKALFLIVSLQGSEGPSLAGFGFK